MKSGIIVSFTNDHIIVMTNYLEYYKLEMKETPKIGATIYFLESMIIKDKRKFTSYNYAAVAALFVMLLLSVIVINNTNKTNELGFLAIQINPEINLIFDENLEILDVLYLNEDAKNINTDQDETQLIPLVESIISQLSELGYFEENDSGLSIVYGYSNAKMSAMDEQISSILTVTSEKYPKLLVNVTQIPLARFSEVDMNKSIKDQLKPLGIIIKEENKTNDESMDSLDIIEEGKENTESNIENEIQEEVESISETEGESEDFNADKEDTLQLDADNQNNIESENVTQVETDVDAPDDVVMPEDVVTPEDEITDVELTDEDIHGSENAGVNSNSNSNGAESSQNANDASREDKDKEDKDKEDKDKEDKSKDE